MKAYNTPLPSPYETVSDTRKVDLHHQALELPERALHERQEAMENWGINCDVLAVIDLPGAEPGKEKRIAVIDYGDIDTDNPPALVCDQNGQLVEFFGHSKTRYALRGLYACKSHTLAHYPLETGATYLGRDMPGESGHASYMLGLASSEANTESISRQHLAISLDESGHIEITDHSTNGTVIELAGGKGLEDLDI